MKTILIIVLIAFAAIGIAGAITWPTENGTVQLSKISFEEIKGMDNGVGGDLASVGMTKEQVKVLDITGEGTGLGNAFKKRAYVGSVTPGA